MNWKTWYPFCLYYRALEDLRYYKKRHDELSSLVNERNKLLNEKMLELKRMWNERVIIETRCQELDARVKILQAENKKLAESLCFFEKDMAVPDKPVVEPRGKVLEFNDD